MTYSKSIVFGTDGWRGIIAADFTVANVCRVTRAIAGYLETVYSQDHPVLIGYDTRFLADQFAATAAAVLAELGWQVKIAQRDCPTPALAYSACTMNSAGALMFTASHNPAAYCGIKYIPDYGGPATTAITDGITANLERVSDALPQGLPTTRISSFNPQPAYLQYLYTFLDIPRIRSAGLKVTYDALYSCSRGYLDEALHYCGCTVESIHTERDVLFGGGAPEPTGQQLTELRQRVLASQAVVGLATDGDSDRFGIVDELGNILPANLVLLLLTRHLVKHQGKTGAIVRTVATTSLLDNLAASYGLPLYETPVGFKYIGEKMRQHTVLIGGEESGGMSILGHIPEKDGILANLLVVEAIAWEQRPLSQLITEVLAEAGGTIYTYRLDLALPAMEQRHLLEAVCQQPPTQVANLAVKQVSYLDGVKLYLEDGSWVLLRPSGTEPLLRVSLETRSAAQVSVIAGAMQRMIETLTLATPLA